MTAETKRRLAECKRLAPDFVAKWAGDVFVCGCHRAGEYYELSTKVVGAVSREEVETMTISACLQDLKTPRAA